MQRNNVAQKLGFANKSQYLVGLSLTLQDVVVRFVKLSLGELGFVNLSRLILIFGVNGVCAPSGVDRSFANQGFATVRNRQ